MFLKNLKQMVLHPRPLIKFDVSECVHYCAFRYGHSEYHPYESYLLGLHQGVPQETLRAEFERFLKVYRPRTLGQALGLNLNCAYPLWLFPWSRFWKFWRDKTHSGWYSDPRRVPDIITHFSESGIPGDMVEQELTWLLGAYRSIATQGYQPDKFGFPVGRLLDGGAAGRACLILDGNHRIASLSALGYESVYVRCARWDTVVLDKLETWAGVKNGFFSKEDAEQIFMAYLTGNRNYRISNGEVPIVKGC